MNFTRLFKPCIALLAAALPVFAHAQLTEAPTTARVGQWLVEADVAGAAWDRPTIDGERVRAHSFAAGLVQLSTGVAENLDVQAAFSAYRLARVETPSGTASLGGHGDAALRAKWNFWGNEKEGAAAALLPYVIIPTSREGLGVRRASHGLLMPFGAPLGDGLAMNAMVGAESLDDGASGRDTWAIASASVTRQLNERWAAYVEMYATHLAAADAVSTLSGGAGATCACTQNFTLDLAIYAGLNRDAPDTEMTLRLVWSL